LKRLDAHLSSLGYCTRTQSREFLKQHIVCVNNKRVFDVKLKAFHKDITIDTKPLDPQTITLLMNKPSGYICSHSDSGKLIYSLLPPRYQRRNPKISTIGRLDIDTTGAILLSDNGELNHKLTSPKAMVAKVYEVVLADELKGGEEEIFASGTILLKGETKPLSPAKLEVLEPKKARVLLYEGRYHQVKRMFAFLGNRVVKLHRISFNELSVDDIEVGKYKLITTL